MKNIKRFAGASIGSMVATLAAIGFTSAELQDFLEQDLKKIMAGQYHLLLTLLLDNCYSQLYTTILNIYQITKLNRKVNNPSQLPNVLVYPT